MRSASANLTTHLGQTVTQLVVGWKIVRKDAVTFRFTTNTRDVTADFGFGEGTQTYKASSGFSRTNFENDLEFNVSNIDLQGFFSDADLKEDEMRAGLFDYAEVFIFLYNWEVPADGVIKLFRGTLGELRVATGSFFEVELRSMEQALTRRIGELYSKDCRADLGDSRCLIPIFPAELMRDQVVAVGEFYRVVTLESPSPDGTSFDYEDRIYRVIVAGTTDSIQPTYDTTVGENTYDGSAEFIAEEAWSRACEVVSVSDTKRIFNVTELFPDSGGTTIGRDTFPDDSMNFGAVTFESTLNGNDGTTIEVRDFTGGNEQTIELFLESPFEIAVGDRLRIYRGCDKTLPVCRDIFDNILRMVAEPYVPGADFLQQYPDAR